MVNSELINVPETMLWTIHNRASEAIRTDGILKDDKAIEIYQSINYDYEKSFGKAEPSHALRSLKFDIEIKNFLKKYPNGCIVNLGEGLETQRFRINNDTALWVSVDLPEAMALREQFIQPDNKHKHCPVSVLNRDWFSAVPQNTPVFITAQGLFMYLKEDEVKLLIHDICQHFKMGYIMFDTIPVWLSKKTMSKKGWRKTAFYTTPKMPWGINRNIIKAKLKSWSSTITEIQEINYIKDFPRGFSKWFFPLIYALPFLKNRIPTGIKVEFQKTF